MALCAIMREAAPELARQGQTEGSDLRATDKGLIILKRLINN